LAKTIVGKSPVSSKKVAKSSSAAVSAKAGKKQAKPIVKSAKSATPKQSASLSVSKKGISTSKPPVTTKTKATVKPNKAADQKSIMPLKEKASSKSEKNVKFEETKKGKAAQPEVMPIPDEPIIDLGIPMPPLQLNLQEKKPAGRSKSGNKASEKPTAAGLEAMKMPEGKGAAAFAMRPKEEKPIIIPSKKKVRYSESDLKMFKQHILKIKEDALDEMRMLRERLEDLTNAELASETMIYSVHMAEQGSEALEKEKTYAQMNRIIDYIKKLDDALKRIDDKTYGICKECNILIAKARLLAVPITTQSASFKIHGRCPANGVDIISGRNE